MKDLLITGYYGFSNIGDEAVLEAIVNQLKAVIPGVRITVLSNRPEETAASYDVNSVSRWKFFKVIRTLWRSDMLIFGGGSLLQDITGTKSILFYLGQIVTARLCGCPVFLYAQGIGPIKKRSNQILASIVLRLVKAITVRDEDSYIYLKAAGIKQKRIYLTCDPALVMEEKEMPPPLPQGMKVGFALREWPGLNIESFGRFADRLVEAGWQVVFLPFNEPKDRELAERVIKSMNHKAFLPTEVFSSSTMFSAIKCMDFVVAMRLHAAVMSAASAVPFLPVVYDPKVLSFASQVGQDIFVNCDSCNDELLWQECQSMVKKLKSIGKLLENKKVEWIVTTKANAVLVREYVFGAKNVDYETIISEINKETELM